MQQLLHFVRQLIFKELYPEWLDDKDDELFAYGDDLVMEHPDFSQLFGAFFV